MTLPETFCVYAIINHSRRELYYGLHDRDAAAAIIRAHEAGQVKGPSRTNAQGLRGPGLAGGFGLRGRTA